MEELLNELSRNGQQGYSVPEIDVPFEIIEKHINKESLRTKVLTLPQVSEPSLRRHFTRLSHLNFALTTHFYPLGSCTMKYNPPVNDRLSQLPGFAELHPYQSEESLQGLLELLYKLERSLCELTGMASFTLQPAAGAHGEFTGLLIIHNYFKSKQDNRTKIIVPDSAHGTNPASAALAGFEIIPVKSMANGCLDLELIRRTLTPEVAAIMLTVPNTLGVFEKEILAISELAHKNGSLLYYDGANLNAILGTARPGDFGFDIIHVNLHKTFSTPHGGGGPGAGPVVLSSRLAPFAPVPFIKRDGDTFALVEDASGTQALGRLTAFHGQMGMFVRALSYILSHGADGLKQASEDAVLNANYVRARLADLMSLPFGNRPCMHEVLFDDTWLKDTGVTTLDFAKAMIDEGYHPMTMYFPLVVHGAMLIEPTESESLASLELFIMTLRDLAMSALRGETKRFEGAPFYAPRNRLDETRAARSPVLRWTKPAPIVEAKAAAE